MSNSHSPINQWWQHQRTFIWPLQSWQSHGVRSIRLIVLLSFRSRLFVIPSVFPCFKVCLFCLAVHCLFRSSTILAISLSCHVSRVSSRVILVPCGVLLLSSCSHHSDCCGILCSGVHSIAFSERWTFWRWISYLVLGVVPHVIVGCRVLASDSSDSMLTFCVAVCVLVFVFGISFVWFGLWIILQILKYFSSPRSHVVLFCSGGVRFLLHTQYHSWSG